jgi:hypothetical protein
MAAPKDSPEQAFRQRRFQGTNTTYDPVFLGPSIVRRSENWVPAQSFRLGKRPGSRLLLDYTSGTAAEDLTDLLACRSRIGNFYLYGYLRRPNKTPTPDAVIGYTVDEQAPVQWTPPTVTFTTATAIGRMIQFRDRVYAGNGVDPLVSWKIGGVAADTQVYGALATLTVTAGSAAAVDNPANHAGESMRTGGYQYCWAVFDTVTGLYVSRSAAESVAIGAGANNTGQTLSVTTPAAALGANQVYRFFIAYRGFPIEYATAQGATAPAGTHTFISIEVTDMRVPVFGVARTGNMFVVWRNRVVFAGSAADPYSVFATDVILPGLEQAIFNQGTMFPLAAKVPLPDLVTAVGIAGVTSDYDATSPLIFCTSNRTFLATGDPFAPDDTSSTLVELSSKVGCIGHDSMVNTPVGTIYCAQDSIYLIPPGGGYPQDIGWPIGDEVKKIAPGLRAMVVAVYHRGFYKIAFPGSPGSSQNDVQWWLDIRQGMSDPPSWWGPHTGQPVGAWAVDDANTIEVERCYAAQDLTAKVLVTHQARLYSDSGTPVLSRLTTGRYDAGEPFIVKVITRLRAITESVGPGEINVRLVTDGGSIHPVDPILLSTEDQSGQWHTTDNDGQPQTHWNTALWVSTTPVEAQTITPYTRPRCLSVECTLEHRTAQGVELRDFEILAILTERKVRYVQTARFPQERVGK